MAMLSLNWIGDFSNEKEHAKNTSPNFGESGMCLKYSTGMPFSLPILNDYMK